MAQAGRHPSTQAASPGVPGRSGKGLQKRGCLPSPQDLEKAPPMGTPDKGTATKFGGLTSNTTGRVDHAGEARHQNLCEVPTVEPHSFFAARHDRCVTWQAHRQHPPAQGSTHWICPSGGLEAVCFHSRSQPGCASEFTATEALEAPLKDADMCFIPKPSKPATTPGNLRPLGIIRPDGKGLAGACRDLLKPITEARLRDIPQFAYQPHRGLSDALGRAIQHVTDVRAACKRHRRTRRELKLGIGKTQLEGGICFALDLSQAFDMVDRADLIATLEQAHADTAVVDLVASLLAGSRYGIRAQGEETHVTSITGIKQGCKLSPTLFSMLTGTMFRELAQLAGTDAVLQFLTGYADDLTVHRDIHSWQDLLKAHQLITDLLEVVRQHGFQVNANKCSVMLKLVGRRAATAYKQFTYWRTAPDGTTHRMWRLGSTKAQEGFPFVPKIKYLGVKLSYGNFEQATLQYRLQEGNVKLQKVRKYVHNRRTAGPKARLHIWNATVWATVASGLADVGLTADTTKLRAWHAAKIRAVLNKPAHLTHISTADLYKQYGIKDPVQKLADRQSNRVKRLEHRSRTAHPDDVSTSPAALERASQKLAQYRDLLARQRHSAETPGCPCPRCDQTFETPSGLRTHMGKVHPGTVDRFVPTTFRQEHAVAGLPHNARLACGISRSGRVSRTIFFQAPVRSRINYANWNFHRKIRRALRGAPPCTPANRCSETQLPRIRP